MSDFTNEAIQVARRLEEISELLANGDLGRNAEDNLYYERADLEEKDRYLSAYFDVVNKNQQLKQRELELMAQVERLKNGLCDLTAESISHEAMSICRELINCTPKQALAEHDAEVVNDFCQWCFELGFLHEEITNEFKDEYINQLRQQADK